MPQGFTDRFWLRNRNEKLKLAEIAFFSDQVPQMSDFYRRLLGVEPVASSDNMTIFFLNETKVFIHYRYLARDGELEPENHHACIVEDVDAACQRRLAQGLMLEMPPQGFYCGRSAYYETPMGTRSKLHKKETT